MNDTVRGLREGSQLGRYDLKRVLGDGGIGEVYEAEDTSNQRFVALKVLPPVFSYDAVFRARLQRQVHVIGRLGEPHIVPIHDSGEIGGRQFLDMQLIAGTDLCDLLKQLGTLPAPRAVAIVRQIASALDATHAIGVVHGDVKPTNILITPADFAYAVDFGIANAAPSKGVVRVIGSAVETWKYTAPERFTAPSVNDKLDIYALTCVLHECLTGSPPYRAESVGALISAHLMEPVPRPSRLKPAIPTAFDEVIAKGMAKDPSERYSSAGELALAAYEALSALDQERVADILKSSQESVGTNVEFRLPLPSDASSASSVPESHQSTDLPYPKPGFSESLPEPASPAGTAGTMGALPRFGVVNASWTSEFGILASESRLPWTRGDTRTRWLALGAAAVAALITLGGVTMWLLRPSRHAPPVPATDNATSSPAPWTAESQGLLLNLLPRGYLSGVCKPTTGSRDALAEVSCDRNSDENGPPSATYTLFPDVTSLGSAFNRIIQTSNIIECPGRIQSPGPWHRNATPEKVSGLLFCGSQQGNPLLGWTDDSKLLIAVTSGELGGPGIDQLYAWWMNHS